MPLRPVLSAPPSLPRRRALRTIAGAAVAVAVGARPARASARSTSSRTYEERIDFGAKAVHLDPRKSNPDFVRSLVDLIDKTELNALVIDIKEEGVYFRSAVELFRDNGVLIPKYDVSDLIGLMHDHGIYTIARLVSFKDPILAERRPDLAVGDTGGGIWRDVNGVPWLNPFSEEVWEANASLAAEAASFGFDEIQLDYVRFPTDGNLSRMSFGRPLTQESRQNAILGYIQLVQEKVRPHGVALGADIFGWSLVVDDDSGIGQNAVQIAPSCRFLLPDGLPVPLAAGQPQRARPPQRLSLPNH